MLTERTRTARRIAPARRTHLMTRKGTENAAAARVTFAEAVKTVRTRRALTQAALAKKAGLSRRQVARHERGLAPGPQSLQRLVGGLGFASGLELLADAGDAEAVEKLKSYADSQPRLKSLVAARATSASQDRSSARPVEAISVAALKTGPISPPRCGFYERKGREQVHGRHRHRLSQGPRTRRDARSEARDAVA